MRALCLRRKQLQRPTSFPRHYGARRGRFYRGQIAIDRDFLAHRLLFLTLSFVLV
jgi:hypothetical protein